MDGHAAREVKTCLELPVCDAAALSGSAAHHRGELAVLAVARLPDVGADASLGGGGVHLFGDPVGLGLPRDGDGGAVLSSVAGERAARALAAAMNIASVTRLAPEAITPSPTPGKM